MPTCDATVRFRLIFPLLAAALSAPVCVAEEVVAPDMYAYDGGYYSSGTASPYASAGSAPFNGGHRAMSSIEAPGFPQDLVSPGMVGPQVPPMPQMPSWVKAWAGEMSDAERDQLEDVYKGLRRINHALTGELMDAGDMISDTLKNDVRDPKAVGKAYGKYFDVQRRWIEAQIAAANRVDELIAAVRARVSQVPPPVQGMGQGMGQGMMPGMSVAPGTISAPITIPPVPEAELSEVPPPGPDSAAQ